MKKHVSFPNTVSSIFLIIVILFSTSYISIAQKQNIADEFLQQSDYLPGVITIKVKEDIGPFEYQKSNVSFGINSLDELVQQFSISALNKRFKHKPIPKNAGLPALDRIYKVEFPEDLNSWSVANAFAKDPNIEYAEPIFIHHTSEIPDDPMYVSQQHLPQIMASEAWDIHKGENGSEEVVVAIVDSGTDWLHPDLNENTWQNLGEDADGDGATLEYNGSEWVRDPDDLNNIDDDNNGYVDDVIGWDFHEEITINNGSNPDPLWNQGSFEHGTHCAGIAAGRTGNGIGISSVSWNIKHMAVQTANGVGTSIAYGYEGIIYAAELGADIISNSWSGPNYSEAAKEVIEYATALGCIVVVAASNDNSNLPQYPGSYPGAISVAAVNSDDTRASFSNYGPHVDIAAPGVGILSTVTSGGYASWNGTSMATPMVSGLLGLVKSFYPSWTNEELINQVIGTTDDIDELNPEYENLLGDGRINAYHALVDENVIPQQELELEFISYSVEENNGNGMIEPGEAVNFNLVLKNWSHLVSSENVIFTLSTFDPDITITSPTVIGFVPADSEFEIENAFEFTVNEGAPTKEVTFFVEVTGDVDITFGKEFQMKALVAPSGIFVWDGIKNGIDHSGSYITQYLQEEGLDVVYSDTYPHSFAGFDAVFLSFGNAGENVTQSVLFDYSHSLIIQEYLETGGYLYIEGMAVMGIPGYLDWENSVDFWNLFGVSSASFAFNANPINSLEGQDETMTEGMVFTGSNQANSWYIDNVIPASGSIIPFYEDNYGNVSVYNEGSFGQKTFYFGYSLADLIDADPHSSRYHVLTKIMNFFGFTTGNDYVVANFATDEAEVLPGDEIQFTDWSFSDEGYEVESWAWDFDEDGVIDSEEQNPFWTYEAGGNYDIMLIVSNGSLVDTLVRENAVLVRSGIFVYEGAEDGVDQSGTFIKDYLMNNGYEVVYANQFPSTFNNFDAVFASYGSGFYTSPELNNSMVNTLKSYMQAGGNVYLEGAQAMGNIQSGSALFWLMFGLDDVNNGSTNSINLLQGQEGTIMEGLAFNSSNQFDVNNIDIYETNPELSSSLTAFIESDYGAVAVQFDGADLFGQKTFCLSYSIANLDDGNNPNTREEVLSRILDFFFNPVGVDDYASLFESIKYYPNPASDKVTISVNLAQESLVNIEVYDIAGKKVMVLPERKYAAGNQSIVLKTDSFLPGAYFIRVLTSTKSYSGKVLIAR
jgi:PKD repeat protein